jgi:hypothetical protein
VAYRLRWWHGRNLRTFGWWLTSRASEHCR